MTKLKVTNTKTGTVHEHENTNHAWGDLACEIKSDLVRGDTERLLTDGTTWYLLDEAITVIDHQIGATEDCVVEMKNLRTVNHTMNKIESIRAAIEILQSLRGSTKEITP